jgi:LuxR family maltose regulon positive regulatory protein
MIDARLASACVCRERGELRRADEHLTEAYAIATRTRRPIALAIHALERALWYLAAGHPQRGIAVIDRVRLGGEPSPPPMIERRLRAVEVKLLLALGDAEGARSTLEAGIRASRLELPEASVHVAVAGHDLDSARIELDRWHLDDGADPRARLERELWATHIEYQTGNRRLALRRASALVSEAEVEGHVRLFLDAGPPAVRLLHALNRTASTPYLSRLVRCAGPGAPTRSSAASTGLSRRELEIVRYLPTPLSSAEIAAQLYISLNTLKTHLRTIYRKLGVEGRAQAIHRAEILGIA